MLGLFKKVFLLSMIIVAGTASYSQDIVYSQNLLDKLNAIRNHDHSNLKTSGSTEDHRQCISPLLLEAKRNFSKLTSDAQQVFSVLATRPSISGEVSYSTAHFKIHYTILSSSLAKVPTTDVSGNGIPDFVDSMASVFEKVYIKEIVELGYKMPPSDSPNGGDAKYDIYIDNIGKGLYGYVSADEAKGNNPNTPETEVAAYTSYMVMNNNYNWVPNLTTIEAIKVTGAHEFFHAIQYGITADCSGFFAESAAAWMEDIAYPGIDDNLQYVNDYFKYPDIALDYQDGELSSTYDGRWYGGWIFWRYVTEHYGNDFMRQVWIRAIDEYENTAYDNEFIDNGTNFRTVFNNWLVANQLLTDDLTYAPFTYNRAMDYFNYLKTDNSLKIPGQINKEKTFSFSGTSLTHVSTTGGGNSRLTRLSADYFTINTNQNFSVTLTPDILGKDVQLFLIKKNTSNSNFAITYANASGNDFILNVNDASLYNSFTLVVSRFHPDVKTTPRIESVQYTFTISNVLSAISDQINSNTKIFPNPASQELMIDYSVQQPTSLEVVDLTGKSIFTTDLTVNYEGHLPLNVSTWIPGVYVVVVKNQEGVVGHQRLIISR